VKKLIKIAEIILFLMFLVLIAFEKQKLTIFLTIPVIIFLYFYHKKANIKNYPLFLFIVAFLIRLVSVLVLKVEVADDFKTMLEASRSLLNHDYSFMNGFYFQTYPFQLGLVLYQFILLKIINNTIILKIMNSIFTSLIVVMIYLISKKIVKEETARVISFAYLFYLYPLYLNSVLTNQHIPALLTLIVIYLVLTKEENIKISVMIAALLALANFFRTESIIIILGLVVYTICYLKKDNYKKKLINLGVCLLTYFALTSLTSQLILISPLNKEVDNKESLNKNVTLWKFYCGLSDKYNGIYNEEDVQAYFNTNNEKELLQERIKKDYKKFPILFLKKEVILWTQTNYDLRIKNNWNNTFYTGIQYFNQGVLNIVIILFVISLFPKRKEEENEKIIFIKILIALYYGIYLFIEISPRYAYNLHMLVFILLGIGLERIICKCNQIYTKNNQKLVECNR